MTYPVTGITNAGMTINSREYAQQASRYQTRQRVFGYMDFKSNLFMSGTDGDKVLSKIGSDIGADLSWNRYITSADNPNDTVFQSANGGTYTNINWDQGTYKIMNEQQFAYSTGAFDGNSLAKDKPYDLVIFGQDQAQFIDYKFSGFADGQTRTSINFANFDNTRWNNNVSYVSQEFNPFAVDFNPYSRGESGIANSVYNQMAMNASQWMTYGDYLNLNQYQAGSNAYNQTLLSMMVAKFDNGNELTKYYGGLS